jgi:hypothetical protein
MFFVLRIPASMVTRLIGRARDGLSTDEDIAERVVRPKVVSERERLGWTTLDDLQVDQFLAAHSRPDTDWYGPEPNDD